MERRDFFVSYTNRDRVWAQWVANVLRNNGYTVYMQATDIKPGDDFLEKMEEFLENSGNFIAVWSEGYSKSKYCMNELRAAYHQWHNGRMECLLPVRIENHPMKALYAALVHVDLFDIDKVAAGKTLMDAVREKVPRLVPVPDNEQEEYAKMLYQRGEDYYHGRNGVQRDYAKARDYYERAAVKGNADALCGLGVLYDNGNGVQRDYAKARDYYERAAVKGNANALFELGVLYYGGNGVQQDYAKARNYWEEAAAKGKTIALYRLGRIYQEGTGVRVDYAKARDYYEQAVANGDTLALYHLGQIYYSGRNGVQQDYAKSRDYYERAAEDGDMAALCHLGYLYLSGAGGVDVDYAKAWKYYKWAADMGHEFAIHMLGEFYENGLGVSIDYAKALGYYQEAYDAGYGNAPADIERLRKKLYG
ncbi:MAG: toll/interleukin-1 receptor domain-containing protein [Oscillibacter sp.]|nr:toll/interleukin-1 receptor domain-containing protein [Oscillibacter sp.]